MHLMFPVWERTKTVLTQKSCKIENNFFITGTSINPLYYDTNVIWVSYDKGCQMRLYMSKSLFTVH